MQKFIKNECINKQNVLSSRDGNENLFFVAFECLRQQKKIVVDSGTNSLMEGWMCAAN